LRRISVVPTMMGASVFSRVSPVRMPTQSSPFPELDPLGVRQGLQGRGVPAALPFPQHLLDGLFGDPGLAGARRGHDEAVGAADGVEGVELKGIRPEGRLLGPPDPGENVVADGFGFGLEPRRVVWTGVPAPAPGREGLRVRLPCMMVGESSVCRFDACL
jgi:hypothetical protein